MLFVVIHMGQKVDLLPRLRGHWSCERGGHPLKIKKHGGVVIYSRWSFLTWCIPQNNIPQMTTVAFGAIIDTWNISIYTHIMDTITTALQITENGGVELLVSEITGSILDYLVPQKKGHAYFYHFSPM